MKNLLLIISFGSLISFAQPGEQQITTHHVNTPDWGYVTKSAGDSCGAYFNNYIGLEKTTSIGQEYMRTGDVVDDYYYNGRAMRFHASQPTEVSGIEFYAYETSPLDSVMVITSLHSYLSAIDSVGPEITRDTVYVKHSAFTVVLPNISVKSYFDTPVVMTDDFIIAMHTPLNEQLVIIANDYTLNEGNGEYLSYALYQNPAYPAWDGWYSNANDFLPSVYDYDYLMSPLVKYDLFTPFTMVDDTICPDVVNAGCVQYAQLGNFGNHMFNSQSGSATTHIRWLWGDGYQNVDITNACHTYANPGTFTIALADTIFIHDINTPYCALSTSQPIVVLDVPVPSFSFTVNGLVTDFVNTSTNSDSVWWNFGDGSGGTDTNNPSHTFSSVSTFDVWMYAYNECSVDSVMQTVNTTDAGMEEKNNELTIYPNPANAQLTISGAEQGGKIEILNMLGETVLVANADQQAETISVNHLSTGTYFVKLTTASGTVTKKLVIKH